MTSVHERIVACLARIAAEDPRIEAFVSVDADGARAAAHDADARRRQGTGRGPLDGLTLAVKDNLAVGGQPWTAGIAGRRGVIAARDATAVAALRAAGAVVLGRTTMAEAAFGAVTDNPGFGRTDNPRAPGHVAGGSSGGSAAAVAAGFADLALGTDTLGSVRIPAGFCGVFGMKPTFGLVGRGGLCLLAPSLDTVGVLAADVRFLWPAVAAVAALAGVDAEDPESLSPPPGWGGRPAPGARGLRVAVPRQVAEVACEPACLSALEIARRALSGLGAEIGEADLAGWEPAPARRAGLLLLEAEGAVELSELMARPGALSPPLLAALAYGRAASSARIAAAQACRRAATAAAHRALAAADLLLLPTTPQRAFPHDAPAPPTVADFTTLANLAGLPAVALPVWLPGEVLPASVQLVGPAWSEARLAAAAEALADALPRFPG